MSFEKDIQKFATTTKKDLDDVIGHFCLELFGAVIADSPVETGRFKSNWNISDTKPDVTVVDDLEEYDENKSMKELAGFSFSFGKTFYLTNNLPYASVLEYGLYPKKETEKVTAQGFSKKAPKGMVRRNVARTEQIMKRAI